MNNYQIKAHCRKQADKPTELLNVSFVSYQGSVEFELFDPMNEECRYTLFENGLIETGYTIQEP